MTLFSDYFVVKDGDEFGDFSEQVTNSPGIFEQFNSTVGSYCNYIRNLPAATYKELIATRNAYALPCEKPYLPTMKDMFNFWSFLRYRFSFSSTHLEMSLNTRVHSCSFALSAYYLH